MRITTLVFALVAVFTVCTTACSGGKSLNSPEELKQYLDKQPANSPDKPLKVSIDTDDQTLRDFAMAITSAGKYVSLNLSGSALTSIWGGVFENCKTLVSVTIPNSVTSIGDHAFLECTSLASVTIPNSVISIGINSFYSCTSLPSVTIPDSVTSIGSSAFYACNSLASVTFQGTIDSSNIHPGFPFPGDLRAKYLDGGPGTYTSEIGTAIWTKQ